MSTDVVGWEKTAVFEAISEPSTIELSYPGPAGDCGLQWTRGNNVSLDWTVVNGTVTQVNAYLVAEAWAVGENDPKGPTLKDSQRIPLAMNQSNTSAPGQPNPLVVHMPSAPLLPDHDRYLTLTSGCDGEGSMYEYFMRYRLVVEATQYGADEDAAVASVRLAALLPQPSGLYITGIYPQKADYTVGDTINVGWLRMGEMHAVRAVLCGEPTTSGACTAASPSECVSTDELGNFSADYLTWVVPQRLDGISTDILKSFRVVLIALGQPPSEDQAVACSDDFQVHARGFDWRPFAGIGGAIGGGALLYLGSQRERRRWAGGGHLGSQRERRRARDAGAALVANEFRPAVVES